MQILVFLGGVFVGCALGCAAMFMLILRSGDSPDPYQ